LAFTLATEEAERIGLDHVIILLRIRFWGSRVNFTNV